MTMTIKKEKWKITSGQFSDGNLVHEKPSGCQQLPGYLKKSDIFEIYFEIYQFIYSNTECTIFLNLK